MHVRKTFRDDLSTLPKPLVDNLVADGVVADASGKLGVGLRKFEVSWKTILSPNPRLARG